MLTFGFQARHGPYAGYGLTKLEGLDDLHHNAGFRPLAEVEYAPLVTNVPADALLMEVTYARPNPSHRS